MKYIYIVYRYERDRFDEPYVVFVKAYNKEKSAKAICKKNPSLHFQKVKLV